MRNQVRIPVWKVRNIAVVLKYVSLTRQIYTCCTFVVAYRKENFV